MLTWKWKMFTDFNYFQTYIKQCCIHMLNTYVYWTHVKHLMNICLTYVIHKICRTHISNTYRAQHILNTCYTKHECYFSFVQHMLTNFSHRIWMVIFLTCVTTSGEVYSSRAPIHTLVFPECSCCLDYNI